MKWFGIILIFVFPGFSLAQSSTVLPAELSLTVEIDTREHTPLAREMILIRIQGTYRRHITREVLQQPDLAGFNWSQLGPDRWWEERINGRKVKRFERKMALFPDAGGTLTIGSFTHNLTLTDEGDDWFDHAIKSEPLTIKVDPAPQVEDWWFPTGRLRISDKWSNAPDQLTPGEGVLRIVQVEALGVTPEMMPPMPELTSPSAMIFAHPEKRLVELSPQGPVTHAFWRWTIRPSNDTSTIVEPLRFSYFDTTTREHHDVVITAQRVAYEHASAPLRAMVVPAEPVRLPGIPAAATGLFVFLLCFFHGVSGWSFEGISALRRLPVLDPLVRKLRRAAASGDARAVRQAASALLRRDGVDPRHSKLIAQLDRAIFAPKVRDLNLTDFVRSFLSARRGADTNG
ncbi:BatD family protein [Roseovarius aestuariivivens]|uniref:BatD family protein n=1 Tax=Roseovarius aestuariivivens TaxID=1888910 RepID=UPI0010821CF3|nr:BatD family protein [Roseovarius aestuariivivens]